MPKQVTVTLGGREYTIHEKHTGFNAAWRKRWRESDMLRVFESLDGFIDDVLAMVKSVPDGGGLSGVDLDKAIGVARVLPIVVKTLSGSMDEIIELLFAYEPKLKSDRKWLDANAYDEEVVSAFIAILRMLFPIMGIWETVTGVRGRPTSGNSVSENGALNGLPASGPKRKALTSS